MGRKSFATYLAVVVFLMLSATGIMAQSYHWAADSTVTFYTDALSAADKAAFVAGLNAWTSRISNVTFKIEDGNAPDPSAQGTVQIKKVAPNDPDLAGSEGVTLFPHNPDGTLTYATIKISTAALGWTNEVKNLGSHEGGHALGLDDLTEEDPRAKAMDPGFCLIDNLNHSAIVNCSPYVAPTNAEVAGLTALGYSVVPEPSSIIVLAGGFASLLAFRRRRV